MQKIIDYVKKIEGKTDEGRKQAILDILSQKKYKVMRESYPLFGSAGENLVVEVGKGEKEILLTAHYDAFRDSPGANDNASSVAVLIDALGTLKKAQLKNKIRVIFFGDSEAGMIGSKYYVAVHGIRNILAAYNLVMTGMGDVVGIWPVDYGVANTRALKNLREVFKKTKIRYEEAEKLALFFTDHEPFRNAGLKDSFSLSLVPSKDLEATKSFVENTGVKGFWMYLTRKIPLMFKLYHTKDDTSKYVSEHSLQVMSSLISKAALNLDAST